MSFNICVESVKQSDENDLFDTRTFDFFYAVGR